MPCGAAAGVPFGNAFRILSHRGSLLGHAGGGSRRAPALFCPQSWQIAARFAARLPFLAYVLAVTAVFETAAFNRSATSPRVVKRIRIVQLEPMVRDAAVFDDAFRLPHCRVSYQSLRTLARFGRSDWHTARGRCSRWAQRRRNWPASRLSRPTRHDVHCRGRRGRSPPADLPVFTSLNEQTTPRPKRSLLEARLASCPSYAAGASGSGPRRNSVVSR